ncbi:hypothetical protein [Acuticoccus sp. I52.16.1]|uniref:hypothetical protein n=1 Tax=Acuticoccus sp. I52.16.1 TaxID=2928472 RepID=UPI001FD62885|nr:hypothetical protein [Acuticoccus sp. I52.16.1]UOM37093.1 hypothetical protein MRB58_23040 [Acuticoccus sp. I52.16.1]
MGKAQQRAVESYRTRLGERGLMRFEVIGRDTDRELIRSLARQLSEDTDAAARLRDTVRRTVLGETPQKGGILAALRRSPLVGADLDVQRERSEGRTVEI